MTLFAGLAVFFSYLVYRFRRVRPVLEAKPLVLLQDGKPIEANLRHEARQQQIASLDDIQWAVVEGSGKSAAAAQRGIRTVRLAPKVLPSRSRIATRTV